MIRSASSAVLLLTLFSVTSLAAEPVEQAANQAARSGRVGLRLFDLAAVRRLFHTLAGRGEGMSEGERAAALADLSVLSEAVVGGPAGGPYSFDELVRAAASRGADGGPRVMAAPGVGQRDDAAYQLLALGYSARETADVVSGRIRQQALDTAQRMMALGQGRDAAADYLDTQYRLVIATRNAARPRFRDNRSVSSRAFDGLIEHYARLHQVDAPLVRAIMHTESAFNPAARSHAGAIGLMQLMPSTARELGVNPFVSEQNIEGGVRYFSQLRRMFGSIELALIAYNAGPGFAQRYARGQTALYGETREYVRRVLSRVNDR
jgi:soluble lytic murein transglycosylase-like protein